MCMYSESYFDKYLRIHLLTLQNGTEEAKLCKTTTFNSRIKLIFSVLHIAFFLFLRSFFCVLAPPDSYRERETFFCEHNFFLRLF